MPCFPSWERIYGHNKQLLMLQWHLLLFYFSGNSYTIEVHFHCSQVGCYEAEVAFEFKLHHPTTAFYIVRSIKFRCRTTLGQKLGPTSPFKPPSFIARTPEVDYEIVEGQRPKRYHHSLNTLKIWAIIKCPVCPSDVSKLFHFVSPGCRARTNKTGSD